MTLGSTQPLTEIFPGGKKQPVRKADNLTTILGPLSRNLGTLTSWNPLGQSRPVTGLLYLLTDFLTNLTHQISWRFVQWEPRCAMQRDRKINTQAWQSSQSLFTILLMCPKYDFQSTNCALLLTCDQSRCLVLHTSYTVHHKYKPKFKDLRVFIFSQASKHYNYLKLPTKIFVCISLIQNNAKNQLALWSRVLFQGGKKIWYESA